MPQYTASEAVRGYMSISLTRPGLCPARPSRCMVLEMVLGQPTCSTRSTSPTSMPSSMEEVAHSSRSLSLIHI